MNLSSRQLRAFVALAQERHFTKAAQRCHTTQPAFSALIKALEDAAGTRLFDRTTRRVELTPEGRLFNESALRLLNDLDGVMQDIQDHVAKRKGRVAVAALPSLAAGWLPGIYARFLDAFRGWGFRCTMPCWSLSWTWSGGGRAIWLWGPKGRALPAW